MWYGISAGVKQVRDAVIVVRYCLYWQDLLIQKVLLLILLFIIAGMLNADG